jgi:hypothetical protein
MSVLTVARESLQTITAPPEPSAVIAGESWAPLAVPRGIPFSDHSACSDGMPTDPAKTAKKTVNLIYFNTKPSLLQVLVYRWDFVQ